MKSLTLKAPAKINLRLKVLGKRSDGYHDLSMIMTRISLEDEITLEMIPEGIELVMDNAELPQGAENIVVRAAKSFFEATDIRSGVRIGLKKKIPIAAGLGGGSSDAATVLKGLGMLFKKSVEGESWQLLAKNLGADVPFFMAEGPQWAEGIGERLSPIDPLPNLPMILVNPGFPVSTKEIFQSLNSPLTGGGKVASLPRHFRSLQDLLPLLENDLEETVLRRHPVVGEIKKELLKRGAAASLMSGSGPTVFAVFRDKEGRDRALELFVKESPPVWKVFPVEAVA
ncbi:MAG: 4-(cytidine 5'-diphospho)-2-C-methyl-D-erythritol kinase [Deltaproteobacteria bacterium]|nr:4-(cytidine 5'-diphospho)-2-C-methyl-D-erythritol kinase [Deltaproteobacteria bacterium]